jgi:plasmid stabilization system protein ParE
LSSAKQDLRAAYLWAAERASLTAASWLKRFEAQIQTLSHFPERYQLAPENGLVSPEIRQLIFGKRRAAYRALFTITGSEVLVLHIRRAARDWATADDLTPE